jgi:hypothetical protein
LPAVGFGTIPKTSAWQNNWDQPALNNFRQNVPGDVNNAQGLGDATAGASKAYSCPGSAAIVSAEICNRGALPVPSGVPVGFYFDDTLVCSAVTKTILFPGDCESVECTWSSPPPDEASAVDLTVMADDGNTVNECKEGNNQGGVFHVFCEPPK